jgi:hypothetical protein
VFENRKVKSIQKEGNKKIELESGEYLTGTSIIIATGAKWKELGIPGEKEYLGRGVAFCPHCDGPFYKGKKIAVLKNMKELGNYSKSEHRRIGVLAGKSAHTVITVGSESMEIAQGARDSGTPSDFVISFANSTLAADYLKEHVKTGDVVLIKGSQSIRMERITKALMANPKDAKHLLVRQEEEWLRKG